MTAAFAAAPAALDRWVGEVARAVPACTVDAVDLLGATRPLAIRSRLRQAFSRVAADLYAAPWVRRAVVLVWTGEDAASPRLQAMALSAAEAMHSRSEMARGCPLGLAVVFVDARTPLAPLGRRLHRGAGLVPDGVAAIGWNDVCAHGMREAAVASHL